MATDTGGIYLITNEVSGSVYVGSSQNIRLRFIDHKKTLRGGRHVNRHLQHAWTKYGESAFTFTVVVECAACELIQLEQEHIENALKTYGREKVYNLNLLACSCLGAKRSEEAKRKVSLANKGRRHSVESRLNMGRSRVGLKRSAAAIALTSAKNTGQRRSPQTKALLSAQRKGRIISNEQRAKISASLKGRAFSQEHRAKIVASLRARYA